MMNAGFVFVAKLILILDDAVLYSITLLFGDVLISELCN